MCFQWNHSYEIIENVAQVFQEVYFITSTKMWVAQRTQWRLSTCVNEDNIEKVIETVLESRRVGIREIAEDSISVMDRLNTFWLMLCEGNMNVWKIVLSVGMLVLAQTKSKYFVGDNKDLYVHMFIGVLMYIQVTKFMFTYLCVCTCRYPMLYNTKYSLWNVIIASK